MRTGDDEREVALRLAHDALEEMRRAASGLSPRMDGVVAVASVDTLSVHIAGTFRGLGFRVEYDGGAPRVVVGDVSTLLCPGDWLEGALTRAYMMHRELSKEVKA